MSLLGLQIRAQNFLYIIDIYSESFINNFRVILSAQSVYRIKMCFKRGTGHFSYIGWIEAKPFDQIICLHKHKSQGPFKHSSESSHRMDTKVG